MREVLLTGSIPLQPASKVFEALARHLGTAAPFYPDGEQARWSRAFSDSLAENPALEVLHTRQTQFGSYPYYALKRGLKSKDLKLGPFKFASNAIASYSQFKQLKDAGVIPKSTRFQVTAITPAMITRNIHLRPAESYPIAAAALWREMAQVLAAIPAAELCMHVDLFWEFANEEYRRRPWAFNIPDLQITYASLPEAIDAFAWVANQIPVDVPFGVHTCSAWHLDPPADQDNRAITHIANQFLRKLKRPLRYLNIPTHPTHTKASDYVPFRDLEITSDTVLSLGVINLMDGLEGAQQRIAAAERAGLFDAGISHWCGFGWVTHGHYSQHPYCQLPTGDTIGAMLDLHKRVASV
jgi:hypothetical protein